MYLCAIIDIYSRYIVGWSISNTMEAKWVVETVETAVERCGKPEIINSDQGAQFTSEEYVNYIKGLGQPGYPWMEKAGLRTMRTSKGSLEPSNTTSFIGTYLKTGSNYLTSVNSLSTSTTVNVLTQALAECRHYRNTSWLHELLTKTKSYESPQDPLI